MAAAFSFSNRRVSPAAVKALETITASVDVTNTGDVAGSVDVHLTGWWALTRSAYPSWLPDQLPPTPTIQPGATETVTFSFFPSIAMGAHDDCPVYLEGVLAGYVDVVVEVPAKATLTVYTRDDSGIGVTASVTIGGLAGSTSGGSWTVEVDPGTYAVTFGALAGYQAPLAQSVSLASGEAKTVTGIYTLIEEIETLLRISLQGVAEAEAEVYLDEESSRIVSSGTPLEIPIEAGFHHVEFGDIEDYVTPQPINFTAAAGQTYLMTITYVPIGQANNTGKMLLAGAGLLGLVMLVRSDKMAKRR